MRYLILLAVLGFASCGQSPSQELINENKELKAEAERLSEVASLEAENAREAEALAIAAQTEAERAMEMAQAAEARALAAQVEADKQRLKAVKALEDCKGK